MELRKLLGAGLLLLTAACASTSQLDDGSVADPLEPMNRAVFAFNKVTDRALIRPITSAYLTVVPEAPRKGISNAMRNLREPWVFINDILQFKFKRAVATLGRFTVNSTVGLGGLFKASDHWGIENHSEDFGQTLATWGFGDGPYLVLPFFGPSNARDTVGLTAYFFGDPTYNYIAGLDEKGMNLTRTGIDALDQRAKLHEAIDQLYLEDDPYVFARTIYWQQRRYEIYDGDPPELEDDFFDDYEDEEDPDGDR